MNRAEKKLRKLLLISLGSAGCLIGVPHAWAGHFRSWSIVPQFDAPGLLQLWLVPLIILLTLTALVAWFLILARRRTLQTHMKPLIGVYLLKTAIPPVFLLSVVSILLAMHYYEARYIILGGYLLLAAAGVYLSGLSWRRTRYEVMHYKILTSTGVLAARTREIPMEEVLGVMVKRPSLVDYLFGTGSVVIRTRGLRVTWDAVPSPDDVVERIGVGR